jgi:hypothetical protein
MVAYPDVAGKQPDQEIQLKIVDMLHQFDRGSLCRAVIIPPPRSGADMGE